MAKLAKNIEVEDFAYNGIFLTLWWREARTPATLHSADVDTPGFEQWLLDTGRLQWIVDAEDRDSEPLQFCGQMELEQYWLYAEYATITQDLGTYLATHWKDLQVWKN